MQSLLIPSSKCSPSTTRGYTFWLFVLLGLSSTLSAAPPQLVGEARWMTDGQDPTYLNLYPLSGRGASSEIYVQVDLTGATETIENQVGLILDNPILLPDSFPASTSVEVIKGNGGEVTVLGVIEVENNINWALATSETVLKLKLVTRDESGVEATFELGDVFLYAPEPGGALPDTEPPMIVEAVINGGNPIVLPEDLEEDEFDFSSTLELTDVWKGIEEASLFYQHEDGGFFNILSIDADSTDLTSGTLNDGVYTTISSAQKYIKSGTYELYGFSVEDKTGNQFGNFFSSEGPEGVQKTVEVVNPNEDLSPPELVGPVIVTPTSGDITTDPLPLTFSFSVKDERTGFSLGTISVFHSTDPEVPVRSFTILPNFLVSGDEFMGSYEVPVEIPQGQVAGDYFYQILLRDGTFFGSATYGKMRPGVTSTPKPLPEGSTEMITITGTSSLDTTPPVLDSFAVAFDQNLAEGPGIMEITMMISEPESEVAAFGNFVRFISPTGGTDIRRTFGLFNQDPETGAYKVTISLDKAIEPGTYCFAVHLENSDGLEADYGQNLDYLPFPNDFPGTWDIVNTGPVDYTPPVPVEFTVTPGFVESGTDVTLSVSLRVIDEGTGLQFLSGFQSTTLELLSGLPGDFGFRQTIFSTPLEDPLTDVRGVGTIFDVTYAFDIPLTGDQFSGDFLSFRLNLTDCAGNSLSYDSSICNFNGSSPFPFNVAQITTNGNEDPIIVTNGGGLTASVFVEEGQTKVTKVRAIDAPGEILTYSITGGADSTLFDLDAISRELTFKVPPSFASPIDTGTDGIYEVTVQVADGNGGVDSQDISVTVTELEKPRPTITNQPLSQTVELGDNAIFSVGATAEANITYQWFKDNVAINDDATISGATSDSLSLSNITEFDLGMYYVVVTSEGESVTSNTATLSVALSPDADFTVYLDSLNVPENVRGFADDADRDGFDNGIEFLMGSDANDSASIPQIIPSTIMVGGQEYFAVSFPENTLAADLSLKAEFSSSINFDASTEGIEVSRAVVSGGVERVTQRSTDTVGSKKRIFGRFRGGD